MIIYEETDKVLRGVTFIDLFCGIGGFHTALSSLGGKCVFASDIDKFAKEVYERNYGMEPHDDIRKIPVEEIPKHDILCAGFPCQPFSISGNRKGFDDPRGNLFFDIVKILDYHRPKVVFLENVKNFEKHDGGKTLERVKSELMKRKYIVYSKVLCASDYGIPQARNRIYIIAFRNDLDSSQFSFPVPFDEYKVLQDILINDELNTIPGTYEIVREYELIINMPQNRSNELLRIGKIGLGRQGERIYSPLGVSTTLSSQGGGLGGRTGMYLINGKVRKLYPRECARLMGFPDTFKLATTQEQNYKLFGNSVAVEVVQLITKEIAKYLS
ncbi:MAG: DNA cytosine methyltransferase [Peptococcaceae bacterium]|nr:DNA cytosine methyltransferase [Peptococcaceae bacterium]